MKLAPFASLAVLFTPAIALACPGAASACASGCSTAGYGPYLAALGVGLLVGMGSIRLEGLFRRK